MLLSIILPCYNVERFITNTLNMLVEQILACANKNEFEIIAVNDGSSDKTGEIIFEFAKRHYFIKAITQENKGVSFARNVGLENATGKYIYFMDSDDAVAGGTLDFWRDVLHKKKNCNIYAFGYKSVMGGKEKKYVFKKYDKQIIENPLLKQIFLAKKICFHICSCIYESAFLRENNISFTPGLKIGEDLEFILKALDKTNSLFYDARECFIYLIRNDSAMRGYRSYSTAQYHSFEVRRDIVLGVDYQREELKNYSNFWIENQLLSNIVYYLRSDFRDDVITDKLVDDCKLLKRSIKGVRGAFKNTLAIRLAKILPVKTILRLTKRQKQGDKK